VTITVRPIIWYSPSSNLCEKCPEPSLPTSVTPFSLAVLLAPSSSRVGLAEVSILNVLAMLVSRRLLVLEIKSACEAGYKFHRTSLRLEAGTAWRASQNSVNAKFTPT
jgi:hypothetical protein